MQEDVFLILWLQNKGFRWIEAFVISLLVIITVSFSIQIFLRRINTKRFNAITTGINFLNSVLTEEIFINTMY